MCSSFKIKIELNTLKEIFNWLNFPQTFILQSETIIYPSQEVEIITLNSIKKMRWGIDLSFTKRKLINIRSETLLQKFPQYSSNRACIPIYSFFEWTKDTINKRNKNVEIIPEFNTTFLALVYDSNQNSFSILTQNSPPSLINIHDRTPCLISSNDIIKYLNDGYKKEISKINYSFYIKPNFS